MIFYPIIYPYLVVTLRVSVEVIPGIYPNFNLRILRAKVVLVDEQYTVMLSHIVIIILTILSGTESGEYCTVFWMRVEGGVTELLVAS
jgi:hypothetical protein